MNIVVNVLFGNTWSDVKCIMAALLSLSLTDLSSKIPRRNDVNKNISKYIKQCILIALILFSITICWCERNIPISFVSEIWYLHKRAIRGQTEAEAVDTLICHGKVVAKEEVRLRPTPQRSIPTRGLRWTAYCNPGQIVVLCQVPRVMVLLSRIKCLNGGSEPDKDTLLKKQFVENLGDVNLCCNVKCWTRDLPESTFQCVHLEVHRYLEEDHIPRQLVTSREIEVEDELVSSKVAGLGKQPKFLSDLISGQNILAEEMKKQ